MRPIRFTISSLLLVTGPALAQSLPMPEAILIAREAAPDRTLVQIDLRDPDADAFWKATFVNAELVNEQDVEIDATSGKVLAIEFDAIDPDDLAVYEAIFADPEAIQIDFIEALEIAAPLVEEAAMAWKSQLDFEAGLLAYQIEYSDETRIYIDAATGAVVNEHGEGEDDDILSPEQLIGAIDAAASFNALPVLAAEADDDLGGDDNVATVVEVLQWNPKAAQLVLTWVDATTLEIIDSLAFNPSGQQLDRWQPVIDVLGTFTVTFADAVAEALAAQPDAIGVHEVALKAEDLGIFYKVELVNAMGFEIDVFVDAFGNDPAASYAGVNYHPCDYNSDGIVGSLDLADLLSVWGTVNPGYDLDGDLTPGGYELGALLIGWN